MASRLSLLAVLTVLTVGCSSAIQQLGDNSQTDGGATDAGTSVDGSVDAGCQPASSPSCSPPPPKCAGTDAGCEATFGDLAEGGSSSFGTGLLFGAPVQITTAITVSRLAIVTTGTGKRARLAIYASDSAGEPSTWMASALPSVNLVVGHNEFAINDPPATTPVLLTTGKYWVFVTVEATTEVAQNGPIGPVRYASWSPWNKAFPTTLSPATVAFTEDNLVPVETYVVGDP
ncbi:MAG: hypothetical protein ABI183_22945 [Polyangiaceae bacterium]